MTYAEREEIFSKDVITTNDLMKLLNVQKSAASVKMQEIKRVAGDRLGIQGRVHIEDYLEYFKIKDLTRYRKQLDVDEEEERERSRWH